MCFFILYTSKYINLLYECHFFRKAKENATRLLAAASYVAMTPQRAHVGLCNDNPWTPSDHLLDLDDTRRRSLTCVNSRRLSWKIV